MIIIKSEPNSIMIALVGHAWQLYATKHKLKCSRGIPFEAPRVTTAISSIDVVTLMFGRLVEAEDAMLIICNSGGRGIRVTKIDGAYDAQMTDIMPEMQEMAQEAQRRKLSHYVCLDVVPLAAGLKSVVCDEDVKYFPLAGPEFRDFTVADLLSGAQLPAKLQSMITIFNDTPTASLYVVDAKRKETSTITHTDGGVKCDTVEGLKLTTFCMHLTIIALRRTSFMYVALYV